MIGDERMTKTNPALTEAIRKLEEASRKNDAAVYGRAAEELQGSTRHQVEVNLSQIERHTDDGDTVLVPGKVLGAGYLNTDVTVAALNCTNSAREAIEEEGSFRYVEDLVKDNPDGEQVKLMT